MPFDELHDRIGRVLLLIVLMLVSCLTSLSQAFPGIGGSGDPPIENLKRLGARVLQSYGYSGYWSPHP